MCRNWSDWHRQANRYSVLELLYRTKQTNNLGFSAVDVMRCGVFVCAVPISVWVYFGRADRTLRHAESVLFCDTLALFTCHTHAHTHKPNDRNMVQAVRNPPGAGSHSAIPLYLSLILFISVSLFISLCLSLSLCIRLFVPPLYIKATSNFFWLIFFCLLPHWDPLRMSFCCFLLRSSSKHKRKHTQVYTRI